MKLIICLLIGLSTSNNPGLISESQLYGTWKLNYVSYFDKETNESFKGSADTLEGLQLNKNQTFYLFGKAKINGEAKIDSGMWSLSAQQNAIGFKCYTRNGMIIAHDFIFNNHIDFISKDTLKITATGERGGALYIYSKSNKAN